MNANYRFIVDPAGDYRAQSIDSDVHVPWDNVLQVLASAKSQTASCPICLCVPVAPRMAKCGHIFCLSCLMRYMAAVEEAKTPMPEKKPKFKKCPICWDSVYMSDVRPVRWFTGQEGDALREGMDVVLRLMRRRHGTTLALPRDGAEIPQEADGIPWHFAAEVADYARVMKGTRSYMEDQFNQEVQDLKVMGREDELMFNEEGEWTRKAIGTIKNAAEGLDYIKDVEPPLPVIEEPQPEQPALVVNENIDDVPDMYFVTHAACSGQITPVIRPDTQSPGEKNSVREVEAGATLLVPDYRRNRYNDQSYYFYRALPHYYLSPFDIRILKAAFGSYENFPTTILPRVEHTSTGHTVDIEFRKRNKYLAHLPYGTEVAFLECDWEDIVPEDILRNFSAEIERRKQRRREKALQEERNKLRAENEDGRLAGIRQRRRNSTSGQQFTEDDFVALENVQHADNASSATSASPPVEQGLENQASFESQTKPGTSPALSRTVWGTPAVAVADDPQPVRASNQNQRHDDGWYDEWERDYLLEEDPLAHHHLDANISGTPGFKPGKGGNNKNKKKKVVLMNNGGKRGA